MESEDEFLINEKNNKNGLEYFKIECERGETETCHHEVYIPE